MMVLLISKVFINLHFTRKTGVMKIKNRIIIKSVLLIVFFVTIFSCKPNQYVPKPGDLLFQIDRDSDFTDAIVKSTTSSEDYAFSHVAIVGLDENKTFVVEAVPNEGVRKVSLEQFLMSTNKSENGMPLVVAYRLKFWTRAVNPVENALKYVGMPYDSVFSHNNGAFYCSELVYECYLDKNQKHIFSTVPMSFSDSTGQILDYWIEYYKNINQEIPEGKPGTNPNLLSKQKQLRDLRVFR
jgi:hypothetical protein